MPEQDPFLRIMNAYAGLIEALCEESWEHPLRESVMDAHMHYQMVIAGYMNLMAGRMVDGTKDCPGCPVDEDISPAPEQEFINEFLSTFVRRCAEMFGDRLTKVRVGIGSDGRRNVLNMFIPGKQYQYFSGRRADIEAVLTELAGDRYRLELTNAGS